MAWQTYTYWTDDAAGEALAAYTLRDGKIVEDQP